MIIMTEKSGTAIRQQTTGLGFLSVFGMTRRNRDWLTSLFSERLGTAPAVISYRNDESCFYFTNHGEIQETGESIYLKLGFLRSPDGTPIVIDHHVERRLNPHDFERGTISGNGYLIRFRKNEPRFTIFTTFMATSQIYYMLWEGGILCATDVRVLLRLAEEIRLNEEAVPLHLMFRILPGPMTYFKDMFRVYPGEIISWNDGGLDIRLLRDMYNPVEKPRYDHLDSTRCEEYFQKLSFIMSSYVHEIERKKGRVANELSGGVDSAVIQLLIGQHTPSTEAPRSFSLTWEAPGFQFEVGYAKLASELLHTEHTYLDMRDRDYVGLLVRAVEKLAQPNLLAENDPGQLALAEHVAANYPGSHVFMGMGGDALHGIDVSEVEGAGKSRWWRRLPGHYVLTESARLFGTPIYRKKLRGLPDVLSYVFMPATYKCLRAPADLFDPVNKAAIPYTTFETVRHFLGDRLVLDALEYRRSLAERTLTSHNVVEQMHDITAVTGAYSISAAFETLFSATGAVLISFYYDQDVIRLVKSVSPEVRYVEGNEVKPILKNILRRRSLDKIIHEKKGSSGFWRDFRSWMMTGSLREMVHSIERPGFVNQKDFRRLIENKHPYAYDLVFPLLTYDIFKKHTARQYGPRSLL